MLLEHDENADEAFKSDLKLQNLNGKQNENSYYTYRENSKHI